MEVIAENRKSRFNYFIIQEFDAGLVLYGSEVKSLRQRKVSIGDAYVIEKDMELWVRNLHVSEYSLSSNRNHDPLRPRKLLLCKKEIHKIAGSLKTSGLTVVPLMLFFNNKGLAKIKIALVKGKKLYDKREAIKAREWDREKSRTMRREV